MSKRAAVHAEVAVHATYLLHNCMATMCHNSICLTQAVRTDASMSKSSAVNAVHPEAVLVVDSMLDGVAEDLNKTIAAEVNLLVNDLIDGLVVDIDEAMRHEVEVIVEEMMCAVVVDFDALVQSEVDNVVSVMMNGLLVDLNKTVQAEVDVIVDEMLGDVVEGVHKAEVGFITDTLVYDSFKTL